jgi:hypothetical protein
MKPAPPVMRSRLGVVGGIGEEGDEEAFVAYSVGGRRKRVRRLQVVGRLGWWDAGGDDRLEAYPTGIRSEFLANPATSVACLRGGVGGEGRWCALLTLRVMTKAGRRLEYLLTLRVVKS